MDGEWRMHVPALEAGVAYMLVNRASANAQARVDELLKRNDSLSAMFEKTVGSMKGRVAGLDSALAASKKETDQIRSRIKGEMQKGGDANVEELSTRLDVAEKRQRALVSAGSVDYEMIAAKDGPATVFIAVQEASGELMSGSGFNVSPSGLIVTRVASAPLPMRFRAASLSSMRCSTMSRRHSFPARDVGARNRRHYSLREI